MHVEVRTWQNKVSEQRYIRVRTFSDNLLQRAVSSVVEVESFAKEYLTNLLEVEINGISMDDTISVIPVPGKADL